MGTSSGIGAEHLGRAGDRRARGPAAGATLVLLCLSVYLPGFFALPTVDRDEARFAQASRQMLEAAAWPADRLDVRRAADGAPIGRHAGGWAVPMVESRPRLNKPPLIYWLQSGAAWVLSGGEPGLDAIWMYRVPSLLAAVLAVLAAWRWGTEMFDARAAWAGAALLAVCPVMFWEARQARSDVVLVAATTAACWMAWRAWRAGAAGRTAWGAVLGLWVAVGVGVMTKGPMTPLVVLAGAAAMCVVTRRLWPLGRLRPDIGALIVAGMVAPWVWMVARQVGWDFYLGVVQREVLGRSIDAAEGHSGPPGYHLAFAAVMFAPGVLFAVPGLVRACARGLPAADVGGGWWRGARARLSGARPGRLAELSLVCLIVPTWYVLELVSTKLPHYPMVLYPALALLAGRAAVGFGPAVRRVFTSWWARVVVHGVDGIVVAFIIIATTVMGLALRSWALGRGTVIEGAAVGAGVGGGCGLLYYFLRHAWRLNGRRAYGALLRACTMTTALCLPAAGWGLPRIETPWVVRGVVRSIHGVDPTGARPVAMVKLHEDSALFELRGRCEWVDEHRLKAWLWKNPRGLVVLPPDGADRWPPMRVLASIPGFNYSKGVSGTWTVTEPSREIPRVLEWMGDGPGVPAETGAGGSR